MTSGSPIIDTPMMNRPDALGVDGMGELVGFGEQMARPNGRHSQVYHRLSRCNTKSMVGAQLREFGTRCSPVRDRRGAATLRAWDRRGRSRRAAVGDPSQSCRPASLVGRRRSSRGRRHREGDAEDADRCEQQRPPSPSGPRTSTCTDPRSKRWATSSGLTPADVNPRLASVARNAGNAGGRTRASTTASRSCSPALVHGRLGAREASPSVRR